MKKLRPKEVTWLIQYHPANRYQNWYLNPCLSPKFMRKIMQSMYVFLGYQDKGDLGSPNFLIPSQCFLHCISASLPFICTPMISLQQNYYKVMILKTSILWVVDNHGGPKTKLDSFGSITELLR